MTTILIKMSNIIPPMISSSPPPMDGVDDDDDDEFGDFAGANLSNNIPDLKLSSDETIQNSWNQSIADPVPLGVNQSEASTLVDENCTLHQDNTSQDSVVSGNTDSGLSSASQHSGIISPISNDRLSPTIGDETISLPLNHTIHSYSSVEALGCATEGCDLKLPEISLNSTCQSDVNYFTNSQMQLESDISDFKNFCKIENDETTNADSSDNIISETSSCKSVNSEFDSGEITGCELEHTERCRKEINEESDFTCSDKAIKSENFMKNSYFDSNEVVSTESTRSNSPTSLANNSEILESMCADVNFQKESSNLKNGEILTKFVIGSCEISQNSSDYPNTVALHKNNLLEGEDELEVSTKTKDSKPSSNEDSHTTFVNEEKDTDFQDEFSDFTSSINFQESAFRCGEITAKTPEKDEFADFEDCNYVQLSSDKERTSEPSTSWADEAATKLTESETSKSEIDDDFDDFESASLNIPDHHKLLSQLQKMISTMFPPEGENKTIHLDLKSILEPNDPVWILLRDLESTNALQYQWAGSASNKALLSALGIDSRNILFGPRWNIAVPRFAANLTFSPLEPVRANAVNCPSPSTTTKSTESGQPEETVPDAQFDWNSSGLVNPLESGSEQQPSITESMVQQILAVPSTTKQTTRSRPPGISADAEKILDSLPDLSFLQAKYLMFPVKNPKDSEVQQ